MPEQRCIHLSATAISDFKACPERFRIKYIEGVRPIEDTESQRMGTNWHKLHEVYRDAQKADAACGDGETTAYQEAMLHLYKAYENVPPGKTMDEWETEREILARSFAGHCWLYQNDPVETVATELSFDLPLHHPKTGLPLSVDEVKRVGKIDWIVKRDGKLSFQDYKSTSKSIDPSSDFWAHLGLDSQISMYALALQHMLKAGLLVDQGLTPDVEVAGAFYDVWKKPQIRPAKLTQAETKEFIANGDYCGSKFTVTFADGKVTVDGKPAEYEPGKKEGTGAIRETPAMFGSRLLADIYANPDKHFARREIARSQADLRDFSRDLYSIYQTMKSMRDTGHWFKNEHSCDATFRCPNTSICYHKVSLDGGVTPPGFKRIFSPLTVEGEQVEI
jgi:RecB family exonuclease